MKALLTIGVLLTEITFGFSTHAVVGEPAGGGGRGSRSASAPVRPGWRLGTPIMFENLTVFPVIGNQSLDSSKFITLDEGLRSGKVRLTEIGANGRARRIRPGQEADDDADVNKLLLTNRTGKTLILIAGEIVVGGKQDRIVGQDCLVASSPRPVQIDVFCVEPGRWHEDAAFGQSRNVERVQVSATRGVGRRSGRGVGRGSGRGVGAGSGNGVGSGSGNGVGPAHGGNRIEETVTVTAGAMAFSVNRDTIAPSNVREQAQAAKDQSGVWAEVAKTEQANNTSSATGNLNAVFENKEVSARLKDYERAFARKLSGSGIVGVIVAVGGKLRSADVFATHSLFTHYWPKLLKAYSLEAASAGKSVTETIDASAAESFLSRSTGSRSSDSRSRAYRLVEHQSDEDASFELVNTAKPSAPLIHFNRVSKQQ